MVCGEDMADAMIALAFDVTQMSRTLPGFAAENILPFSFEFHMHFDDT
jgi:hypothetical protein